MTGNCLARGDACECVLEVTPTGTCTPGSLALGTGCRNGRPPTFTPTPTRPSPSATSGGCGQTCNHSECDGALCGDFPVNGLCELQGADGCGCVPFECRQCEISFDPVPATVDGLTVTLSGDNLAVQQIEVDGGAQPVVEQIDSLRFAIEVPLLRGVNHLVAIARRFPSLPPPCYRATGFDVEALGNPSPTPTVTETPTLATEMSTATPTPTACNLEPIPGCCDEMGQGCFFIESSETISRCVFSFGTIHGCPDAKLYCNPTSMRCEVPPTPGPTSTPTDDCGVYCIDSLCHLATGELGRCAQSDENGCHCVPSS